MVLYTINQVSLSGMYVVYMWCMFFSVVCVPRCGMCSSAWCTFLGVVHVPWCGTCSSVGYVFLGVVHVPRCGMCSLCGTCFSVCSLMQH